jgi:hypothetical protein
MSGVRIYFFLPFMYFIDPTMSTKKSYITTNERGQLGFQGSSQYSMFRKANFGCWGVQDHIDGMITQLVD